MKKTIRVEDVRPMLISVTDIAFANVPHWNGFRQLKMTLLLAKWREQDPAPRPLLVWLCGGGFTTMDKDVWVPELQYFARNGYAIASVEYRTQNMASFPAQVQDVKAAIRYLRAHAAEFSIDPDRIAVMGESAGAYLANMVGMTAGMEEFDVGDYLEQRSDVQAVVNYYGRSRMVQSWQDKQKQVSRKRNTTELLLGGTPEQIPEVYEKASHCHYVREGIPPFLLLHGTGDTTVPIEQNDLLYDELSAVGNDVVYYVLEDGVHGDPKFFQEPVKQLVLEFLDRHLKQK